MPRIKDIQIKNTLSFLSNFTDDTILETKEEILRKRTRNYKSGRVVNSPINSSGSSIRSLSKTSREDGFDVHGNDYLEDVDEGTDSTRATLSEIMSWIKKKPVKPSGSRLTPNSTKSLARVIQKSLVFNGIHRTAFLTDLVNNSYDRLQGIEESVADDVVDSIEDILEDVGLTKKGEKYVLDIKR